VKAQAGGQANKTTAKKRELLLIQENVYGIPEDNFTINIELLRHSFSNVELFRQSWIVSKETPPGREPTSSGLPSDTLPLCHTFCLITVGLNNLPNLN
jgi:hypothetical protein